MQQHPRTESVHISLRHLFTDPYLRRVFRDAERDQGFSFAIPEPGDPVLDGGAMEEPEAAI